MLASLPVGLDFKESQGVINKTKGKTFCLKADTDLVRIRSNFMKRSDACQLSGEVKEINPKARFSVDKNPVTHGYIILKCDGDSLPDAMIKGNLFLSCFERAK